MQVYLTLVRRLSSGSDWQFLRPPVQMSPRSDPARLQAGSGLCSERICHSALEGEEMFHCTATLL